MRPHDLRFGTDMDWLEALSSITLILTSVSPLTIELVFTYRSKVRALGEAPLGIYSRDKSSKRRRIIPPRYGANQPSHRADPTTGVSGVAVGAGWQSIVAYVNIGCYYYIIGIPVGVAFSNILHLQVKGIWIGMLFGTLVELARRRVNKFSVDVEEADMRSEGDN
ncbi:hypothetical protein K1719_027019 [Acacia pycnantha]|nr:hypothetical protein K1719_027019 [Acacia pycnantha]